MRDLLRRFGQLWDKVELVVGGALLTLSALLVIAQILSRAVFRFTISGADEISRFLIVWSALFTASIGVKHGIHVKVDVLLYLLPQRVRELVEAAGCLVAFAFTGYLTYSGILLVQDSIWMDERMVGSLRLPMWIPQSAVPLGGVLLSLRLLQRAYTLIAAPEVLRMADRPTQTTETATTPDYSTSM